MEMLIPSYPLISNRNFVDELWKKKEFYELRQMDKSILYPHQEFIRRFMSPQTCYNNLLLFHNVGSGKTFTSIAVAESHGLYKTRALVLVRGKTSADNFKSQIHKWSGGDNKNYEIKRYISFANKLKRLDDSQVISSFSNKIIIMDEIHNLKYSMSEADAETVYGQIWRLSHLVNECKILLLSATPMIDKVEEILSILNLILDVDHQFDTSTFPNERVFRNAIRGRISYLSGTQRMAQVIEEGTNLGGCSVKVIPSFMKGFQLEAYKRIDVDNLDDSVYRNSIYCSLMTFWDGSYGSAAFAKVAKVKEGDTIKYTFTNEVRRYLNRENVHLYSCKYAKVLDIIESNSKHLAFVFCEEVKGSGLIVMSCMFELFGYKLYNGENIDGLSKALRYTIYTGDPVACSNPEARLDGFRSPKNKYGEYVKVLLGSRINGESVSLVNVRQVHVVTPHWNKSTIVQAIGRAVRSQSHDLLEEGERLIHIYRHVALLDNSENYTPAASIDMYKYIIADVKSKRIEEVERIIKECCIDYYLNVDSKVIHPEFGSDISTYLLWHSNHIERLLKAIVSKSEKQIHIDEICSLLNVKDNVIYALIGKGITFDDGSKIRETNGMIYRNLQFLSNQSAYLSSFEEPYNTSLSNFVMIKYEDRTDLIITVSSMTISQKVKLLESAIVCDNHHVKHFFENSFDYINGKWYHILLYRASEDNYSYSLSTKSFRSCRKTKVLVDKWSFASDHEESNVIKSIISKSKQSNRAKAQDICYIL